jgi:hypothetical protein
MEDEETLYTDSPVEAAGNSLDPETENEDSQEVENSSAEVASPQSEEQEDSSDVKTEEEQEAQSNDAVAHIEKLLKEEEEGEQKAQEEEDESPPEGASEQAKARWAKLLEQRNNAREASTQMEQQLQAHQQQMAQVQQYVAQMQRQFQEQRDNQLSEMQKQWQQYLASQREQQQRGNETQEQRAERLAYEKLDARVQNQIKRAIEPFEQQLQERERAFQQMGQEFEVQKNAENYKAMATQATREVALKGIPELPEQQQRDISGLIAAMAVYSKNRGPNDPVTQEDYTHAAKRVRNLMLNASLGIARASSKPLQNAVSKNKAQVSRASIGGRVKGKPAPTYKDAQEAGFSDELEMGIANSFV